MKWPKVRLQIPVKSNTGYEEFRDVITLIDEYFETRGLTRMVDYDTHLFWGTYLDGAECDVYIKDIKECIRFKLKFKGV